MAEQPSPPGEAPANPPGFAEQALRLARFMTRLPLPAFGFEQAPHGAPDLDRAAPALPLIGVVVGGCGALTGGLAYLLGISTLLAATLSIGAMLALTGAIHEDGFADCCDGFFGGTTPERRLEIMHDSRLGTFGSAGLMLGLLLRVVALAELFRLTGPAALVVLIGVAALARPLAMAPALWLPPAASGGMARAAGAPGAGRAGFAIALGLALALACAWPAELVPGMLAGALAALIAVYGLSRLAAARIGGYTGDVLGAAEQMSEIVLLVALSAAANGHGPV